MDGNSGGESLPCFFFQGTHIGIDTFDLDMILSRRATPLPPNTQTKAVPVCVVTTTIGHAKIMAMVLKRAIKRFEDEHGKVTLPPETMRKAGLSEAEDW